MILLSCGWGISKAARQGRNPSRRLSLFSWRQSRKRNKPHRRFFDRTNYEWQDEVDSIAGSYFIVLSILGREGAAFATTGCPQIAFVAGRSQNSVRRCAATIRRTAAT